MNHFGNLQRAEPTAVNAALSLSTLPGTQAVSRGWGWKKASGAPGAVLYH